MPLARAILIFAVVSIWHHAHAQTFVTTQMPSGALYTTGSDGSVAITTQMPAGDRWTTYTAPPRPQSNGFSATTVTGATGDEQ